MLTPSGALAVGLHSKIETRVICWIAAARSQPVAAGVLLLCLVGGVTLRIVATIGNWPTYTGFADSWPYAELAGRNPFADPQHPAGYSLFLGLVGQITRWVAVPVLLQNLIGIAGAFVLGAAVRRVSRTPWPAVLALGVVLLDADEVFVEHTIMSESLFTAAMAGAFYASVRALEGGARAWRWTAGAAAFAALAALMRTAGLFYLPVVALALFLAAPRGVSGARQPDGGAASTVLTDSRRGWVRRLRMPALALVVGGGLLIGYASANAISNGRFEVSPATGWHLYAKAATFADCRLFTPPVGTASLCQTTPPQVREGPDFYLYSPNSPALRTFKRLGNEDGLVGAWARAAILAEPSSFLRETFHDIEGYFVPSLYPYVPGYGCGIGCQVDWSFTYDSDPKINASTKAGMERFFAPFTVHTDIRAMKFLHAYQHAFRFGGTLLVLNSLLTLLGLAIGPRTARLGVLLFGGGSLTMLLLSTFGVYFLGRYSIPLAGPMTAAGGLCVESLWLQERSRRRAAVA